MAKKESIICVVNGGVLGFYGYPDDFSNDAENGQLWADMSWINNNGKFEFNRADDLFVD